MGRYRVHAPFIHPDTGERHMPSSDNEEVELPDDGNPKHAPSVHFTPLDLAGAKAIKALIQKKRENRNRYNARLKELGGDQTAKDQLADEMLRDANGHIANLDQLEAGLDEYLQGQREFEAAQKAEKKSTEAAQRADAEGGRGIFPDRKPKAKRANDESVLAK